MTTPRPSRIQTLYGVGVAFLAVPGFLCPVYYLGFVPLGVGILWAVYDLIDAEVPDGDTARTPR